MPDPNSKNFDDWAKRTRRAVRRAEAAEHGAKTQAGPMTLRPAETAAGVLYVRCYRYYRKLKRRSEWLNLLADHLRDDADGRWRRHKGVGSADVLRLLEQPRQPWFVTPSRRKRIVAELNFADRYNIAPELLLGFLHEAGPNVRIVKMNRRKPDLWVEDYQWVSKLLNDREAERRKAKKAERRSSLNSG